MLTSFKRTIPILLFLIIPIIANAQTTPPNPTSDRNWNQWWQDNSVADVEQEFNAARRNEENQRGLPNGTLGNLSLPSNFLSRSSPEQALILINAERAARHNVNYPGFGTVQGLLFEGVDLDLNQVAQQHANDMHNNNFFSHTGSNGSSPFQRINAVFGGCHQGSGENIAWNSSGGFILSVPLAIYNFLYDDGSCCNWGHRLLCLKQNINNNYGDPNKIGLVGFGRKSGSNGDYFVMNYIDPIPSCTYDVTNYSSGGGSSCPTNMTVSSINKTTYEASNQITSNASISSGQTVNFYAGQNIRLTNNFRARKNSSVTFKIQPCGSSASSPNALAQSRNASASKGIFRMDLAVEYEADYAEASRSDDTGPTLYIFPNPANNVITVQYEIFKAGNLEIAIFDKLGKKVSIIRQTNKVEPGQYREQSSVADLQNGMYVVSLESRGGIVSKQLVVHN